MSLCTYGLLACSTFPAQPCELKLLHAAIKGGKVTKAGGSCVWVSCNCLPGHLHHHARTSSTQCRAMLRACATGRL
jgi:hypothetical protein